MYHSGNPLSTKWGIVRIVWQVQHTLQLHAEHNARARQVPRHLWQRPCNQGVWSHGGTRSSRDTRYIRVQWCTMELPGSIACSPSARQSWTNWRACAACRLGPIASILVLCCENGFSWKIIRKGEKDPKRQLSNTGAPPAQEGISSQRPLITVPEEGDGHTCRPNVPLWSISHMLKYCTKVGTQESLASADWVWDGSNKSQNKSRPETAVQETSNHNGQSGCKKYAAWDVNLAAERRTPLLKLLFSKQMELGSNETLWNCGEQCANMCELRDTVHICSWGVKISHAIHAQ